MAWLAGLPERLDDAQLAEVRAVACSPLPTLVPVSPEQFASALRKLSVLPRRADDETTGEERVKVYARMLGSYPAEAIGHMVRTVLETCDWFPSPRQCLAILERWERRDEAVEARYLARCRCNAENERRWSELVERFRRACDGEVHIPQAEIDALPDDVKRRLDTAMLLLPDGSGTWRLRMNAAVRSEAA